MGRKKKPIQVKRRLIPYAGYDKSEQPGWRGTRIPVDRAIQLREGGLSWRDVATVLNEQSTIGRRFTADGVYCAVKKHLKRRRA